MQNRLQGAGLRALAWTLALSLCLAPVPLPAQSPPALESSVEEGLLAVCDQAAGAFLEKTRAELEKASAQGPKAVLSFCKTKLPELEKGFSNPGISLRLMGFKFGRRNPGPDVFDLTAMTGLARAGKNSSGSLGFFINPEGRGRVYRYYREVRAGESCLACHGAGEGLNPGMRELLEKEFPGFDGYGFKAGDLMGAVGIRVLNPPGG